MALYKKRTVRIERIPGIDLTDATVTQLRYIKPDGLTKGAWTANVDGSILWYKTTTSDIDQSGDWQIQAYVEVGADKYSGDIEIETFEIPIEI